MYSFGDRVEPADRWAIVAYIRALQLAGEGSEAAMKIVPPNFRSYATPPRSLRWAS